MAGRGVRPAHAVLAVLGICLLGAGAMYGMAEVKHADEKEAQQAAAWSVNAPPCQEVDSAAFAAAKFNVRHHHTYEGVEFGRSAGHVDCDLIGFNRLTRMGGEPACQFTGPNAVTVKTAQGEQYFLPGIGHPVTVFVENGHARCVLGSNFKING